MIGAASHPLEAVWLRYVAEPAARALLLGATAWLLLGVFRVREITLRLAVWTTILYAALAMPLLGRIVPQVQVPMLPAQTINAIAGNGTFSHAQENEAVTRFAVFHLDSARAIGSEAIGVTQAGAAALAWLVRVATQISLPAAVLLLYFSVAVILLSRFAFGWAAGFRLLRKAQPVRDERLRECLVREADKAGLRRVPPLAESGSISVPVTLGVFQPSILLPLEWAEWNDTQTAVVLAHELSHIARHDGVTRTISRLHRALFWFSPLSWWLDGELAELAEQASDDAALRSGADRARYADVLLHFFRALKASRGRVRWEGVSMAHGSRSVRRLERILDDSPLSRGLGWTALFALVLGAVPLICLAAALRPSRISSLTAPQALGPPAPPWMAFAKVPVQAPIPGAFENTKMAAQPVRAVPALEESSANNSGCHGNFAFAVVTGRAGISACASTADIDLVWWMRRKVQGDFVWFRENGRSYIIANPAIVRASLVAFAPLQAIEWRQAALDEQEDLLLHERMNLGASQIASDIAEMKLQWEVRAMETQLAAIAPNASSRQWNRAQAALAQEDRNAMRGSILALDFIAQNSRLEASASSTALKAQQAALICQQAELEAQQAALARQALLVVRTLINRSVLRGTV